MPGPLDRYMRVGIVHFMAFPETMGGEGPVVETVRKIAEDDFFGAIEVSHIKDSGVREEVKKCIEENGLKVSFGAQPMLLSGSHDLNSEDAGTRDAAITVVKSAVDQAQELNAGGVALLSGIDPGDEKRDEAVELLVDSMEQLAAYAADRGGIDIILETFDRDIDKRCLVGPAEDALRVAEAVRKKHSNFGLMYDLSHLPLIGERADEALQMIKDYLVHIHVGNCVMRDESHPAYGDLHPRFGLEGGENNVQELADFLKVLLDIGYLEEGKQAGVAFEVRPQQGETSEMVIANSKQTLRSAWSLI